MSDDTSVQNGREDGHGCDAAAIDKVPDRIDRVCIYVLDKSLQQTANVIKDFLTQRCQFKSYKSSCANYEELRDNRSIGNAVYEISSQIKANTDGHLILIAPFLIGTTHCFGKDLNRDIINVKSLIDLIDEESLASTQQASTAAGTGPADNQAAVSSEYEVVIILGHSNVYNIGPYSMYDILQAVLRHKPVIVAFLGCCGGSMRYGPLLMASHMQEVKTTIFGFYQRRIYIDELLQTSLVVGIRNYLRLSGAASRTIAKDSFIHAAIELNERTLSDVALSSHYPPVPDDPTIFANDSDKLSTLQSFLTILKEKFPATIPLSCLQWAIFQTYTQPFEETAESMAARQLSEKGVMLLQRRSTVEEMYGNLTSSEIEEKCKSEIKKRHLDKLIDPIAKMHLLHVSQATIIYLNQGRWREVDHLQFFVAVLHGYWGKNSYKDVRKCACFHLNEMRKQVSMSDSTSIKNYLLCAAGFLLFCEKTYVAFEVPGQNSFHTAGLVLHSKLGFFLHSKLGFDQQFEDMLHLPAAGDLKWINRFYECKKIDKFIELHEGQRETVVISNYYARVIEKMPEHNYTMEDFKTALATLQQYIFDPTTATYKDEYNLKEFENKTSRSKGRMECFIPFWENIQYVEMWVTKECDTPSVICRCRFVYQYFINFHQDDPYCEGKLYFTDSHYGWDWIPEKNIDQRLNERGKYSKDELKDMDFYKKLGSLKKEDLHDLQNEIKESFPFYQIGFLKMEKTKCELEPCVDY